MKTLKSLFPLYLMVAGILMLATAHHASAQAAGAPAMGPLAAKVAAKLDSGKNLVNASPGELREAVEEAVAENTGQAKEMVLEVLAFLSGGRVGGLTERLVIAVMRGAFSGAPNEVSAVAEAAIEAYPEWRETIMRLLNRTRPGNPGGGAGPGPGFGGGPGGVGGMPDDDDEDEVTPDKPK